MPKAPSMESAPPLTIGIESMPARKTLYLLKLYIVEYIFLRNIILIKNLGNPKYIEKFKFMVLHITISTVGI